MKESYVSVCCQVPVEYGKNYSLAALGGEESFRCPQCKEDPCEVERKNEEKIAVNRWVNFGR